MAHKRPTQAELKKLTRTLQYDVTCPGSKVDLSAISDDCVNNCLESLNDDAEGYKYSFEQVKYALWRFMDEQIDELLENIEDHFMDFDGHRRDQLLGEPEIDVAEEQRLEHADYLYDAAHGN